MKVKDLRRILENYADDIEIYVGCQGYSNYDFGHNKAWEDSETQIEEIDGKLFITDCCEIERY